MPRRRRGCSEEGIRDGKIGEMGDVMLVVDNNRLGFVGLLEYEWEVWYGWET